MEIKVKKARKLRDWIKNKEGLRQRGNEKKTAGSTRQQKEDKIK